LTNSKPNLSLGLDFYSGQTAILPSRRIALGQGPCMSTHTSRADKFWSELRLIARRAWTVWRMVPHRHKGALAGAALLMILASATATAVPVCLGRLVDAVKRGTEHSLSQQQLFAFATWYLGAIALLVLTRELLNVIRRFLVENTGARQLGHNESAELLRQTLSEEKDTDQKLTGLAEHGINVEARSGA
jgi:hypothetical protein